MVGSGEDVVKKVHSCVVGGGGERGGALAPNSVKEVTRRVYSCLCSGEEAV